MSGLPLELITMLFSTVLAAVMSIWGQNTKNKAKQQEMMIELMHSKGLGEHIDGPPGISAKKPHPPSSPPQRDTSSKALGNDMAERFHKIQPRPSHSSTYYVGGHDMEAFFRHNLEMAKLIQENAELRKDRLEGDMIRGVHE